MTPVEQAAQVYSRETCPRTFREDLELHLLNGYVFSTPDYFCMGRPVDSSAPYELVTNPAHVFPVERCDAWMVYLMAGNMAMCWTRFPFPLPKIGFERKNKLRYYRFEFLELKISASRQRGAVSASHLQDYSPCDIHSLNSAQPMPPTTSGQAAD